VSRVRQRRLRPASRGVRLLRAPGVHSGFGAAVAPLRNVRAARSGCRPAGAGGHRSSGGDGGGRCAQGVTRVADRPRPQPFRGGARSRL